MATSVSKEATTDFMAHAELHREEFDGAGSGICTLVEEICSLSRSYSAKPARVDLLNAILVLSMSARLASISLNCIEISIRKSRDFCQ